MANCPVCEKNLPDLLPPFCDQCSWDLENDITLKNWLDKIPQDKVEAYLHRLEIAKRIWQERESSKKKAEEYSKSTEVASHQKVLHAAQSQEELADVTKQIEKYRNKLPQLSIDAKQRYKLESELSSQVDGIVDMPRVIETYVQETVRQQGVYEGKKDFYATGFLSLLVVCYVLAVLFIPLIYFGSLTAILLKWLFLLLFVPSFVISFYVDELNGLIEILATKACKSSKDKFARATVLAGMVLDLWEERAKLEFQQTCAASVTSNSAAKRDFEKYEKLKRRSKN